MRVVLLSAFPALDRHPYKRRLLANLSAHEAVSDVVVVYGQSNLLKSIGAARRLYSVSDGIRRLKSSNSGDSVSRIEGARATGGVDVVKSGSLSDQATKLQIEVRKFDRFGDPGSLGFLQSWKPDLGFNLSGLYVPESIYSIPEKGFFGGHFAELPRVRGADTVRWTVLLDLPMIVSHQVLSKVYDMGDVALHTGVNVKRGDTLDDIRAKCREAHADGCLEIVSRLQKGTLQPARQSVEEGSHFRRMGDFLSTEVDTVLKQERYSHYAN